MTQVLSKPAPAFDISSTAFRAAASDLGEVIALLAGGLRPDPETISRLGVSLRALQGFLLDEAEQQAAREAIAQDPVLSTAFMPVSLSVPPWSAAVKSPEEIAEDRRMRASA